MNKLTSSFQTQHFTREVNSTATPPVFVARGKVSVDDVFGLLERRAQQGAVEHVTFDSVGMTAEDLHA